MPLSDEVRRELAAIDPQRDCDRLAELSGLFHTAGSLHLRGHGEFSVHLDVAESAVGAPRVRPPARVRRRGRDPDVPPARLRGRDAVPDPRAGRRAAARRARPARACCPARTRRSSRRPGAVVGRPAAGARTCAGRSSAPAPSSGPRSPHLEIRTRERWPGRSWLAAVAAQEDVPLQVRDRGRHAAAYAKGAEPIADALALIGAGDTALSLDEHAVVAEAPRPGEPGRQRRPREPRPREPSGARADPRDPAARAEGRSRGSRPPLREIAELRLRYPSPRCASSRRNAARRRRRRPPTGA